MPSCRVFILVPAMAVLAALGCSHESSPAVGVPTTVNSATPQTPSTNAAAQVAPSAPKTVVVRDSATEHKIQNDGSFFFADGRYIRQPVTLTISGNRLLLNDFVLFDHPAASPEMSSFQQEKLPDFPAEITETSSWEDIDKIRIDNKRWSTRFYRYYVWNFPYDEAIQKLVAAYRELPFVAKVEIVDAQEFGPGRKYLNVTSKAGDVRSPLTVWYSPDRFADGMYHNVFDPMTFRPYPKEFIEKNLTDRFRAWKEIHGADEVAIVSTKFGSIQLNRAKQASRWGEIVNIVRILNSTLARDEKFREIFSRIDSDDVPGDTIKPIIAELVDNFRPDPQLDARIKLLEPTVKIPRWTMPAP